MALTVVNRPDSYSAAYLPVEYKFTSNLSPNSVAGESNSTASLRGTSFSGADVLINTSTQPLPLIVGDFVYIENAGEYNGVHRVSSILSGLAGVSVTEFYIDTPVVTEEIVIPFLNNVIKIAAEVSKYYNNYNAVADVYIGGSFVVRLREKRNFDNEFIFDLSSIIQEYLGSDLLTLGTTTTSTTVDLSKEVYIQYAEEYDTISNGIATLTLTDFTDDSANTFTAVNSTIPYVFMNDFAISSTNYNLSDYYATNALFTSASAYNWLTRQPDVRIGSNDSYQMSFINGTQTYNGSPNPIAVDLDLVLKTYDSQGALLATDIIVLDTDTTTNLEGVYNVPVGPANLSAYITSNVAKYEVRARIDGFTLANYKTFIIEDDCNRILRRFEWVNSLGGIDSFTFKGKEVRDIDVEKQTFKRIIGASRSIPERSVTTFGVQTKDIYNVNSGIVSRDEKEWLLSLIESPEVYIVVDGYRLPVQLTTDFSIEKLAEYSYNVSVEYELAYDKIIQRN